MANRVLELTDNKPLDQATLDRYIRTAAGGIDSVEYKQMNNPRSTAWKEFIKDVRAQIKGQLRYSRGVNPETTARKAQEKAELEAKLTKIAYIIQDAASQAFPDGDPFDIIIGKMRRMGITNYDIRDWLDRAAKHVLGVKDYDTYMADMYDDYAADSPELLISSGIFTNPYSNKPFDFIGKLDYLLSQGLISQALAVMVDVRRPRELSVKTINANKKAIIKALLGSIKSTGRVSSGIIGFIEKLNKMGIDWQEFDAIRQSYR